tara:strand:+ start:189 stop:1145 length:957 start_codon:yes stop_codon:yes gene_type:complete
MKLRISIFTVLMGIFLPLLGEGINFENEILPILEDRCIECHKAPYEKNGRLYKPKAGLRMDGLAHLMFGSDDGPVLVPNHPSKSSVYNRIILPAEDDDIMPPKGNPLTKYQQELIRKWIGQGADFGSWVGATDGVDKLIRHDPAKLAKIPDFVSFFQKFGKGKKPVDSQLVQNIRKATGLLIRPIGRGSPLLEVRVVTLHERVNNEVVKKLLPLANWVVRLDIRGTLVTNQVGDTLAQFSSLVELNLRGCQIGDAGVAQLDGLKNLQTLNLGMTEVGKEGVAKLLKLPALTTLNLWQSKVGAIPASFGPVRTGLRIIN